MTAVHDVACDVDLSDIESLHDCWSSHDEMVLDRAVTTLWDNDTITSDEYDTDQWELVSRTLQGVKPENVLVFHVTVRVKDTK